MDEALINFILAHENDDLAKLILKQKNILGNPVSFVADQINGRRRAKEKLPTWYSNPAIVYPPQQNLEQCSSEVTAKFKCEVISVGDTPSETIADLTGGFGVDSFFFSQFFSKVYHVEPDSGLCRLTKKNHELLGSDSKVVEYIESSAEDFLSQSIQNIDWIYLDPSRKTNGKKVLKLTDSQPDITKLLPRLFSKTKNILIKTSPLLDLKEGFKQLPGTKEIFVVSVGNECKEVLFRLEKDWNNEPQIICVNLIRESPSFKEAPFRFRFSEEAKTEINFGEPQEFIYEPNTSILKAGAFKSIAKEFGLSKIAVNTHLYTDIKLKTEFPGRIFKVSGLFPSKAGGAFNIISRNYPLSPEQIKKKFKLKDGGEKYLLAFSGRLKKYLMVAERVR